MNGIINKTLKHPSFPKIFFLCSVIILIMTLIKVFVWIPPQFSYSIIEWAAKEFIAPVAAGGIIVGYGINDFQGTPYSVIGFQTYCTTFLSLLLTFVLGPVAFLSIGKRLKEIRLEDKVPSILFRTGYAVCFVWMIFVSAYFIGAANSSYSASQFMRNDIAVSKYRNDVINEMNVIGNTAQLYYILPSSEGGGGNTFHRKGERILLSDLGFKETTTLGRFLLYHQRSDTVLYVHFIGNKEGKLVSNYRPEETKVIEYQVEITPSSYYIKTLH